jgi:hypothetical protein
VIGVSVLLELEFLHGREALGGRRIASIVGA